MWDLVNAGRIAIEDLAGAVDAFLADSTSMALAQAIPWMFSRRLSPVYFDHVVAACAAQGFSPRILHEVRSVTSQIAFVGCGQGIALVPSRFERLAPPNVAFRPLKERVDIVAAALVWSVARHSPMVESVITLVEASG